jgi:predicted NBD/HSP70 family sugar kinase
MKHVTEKKLRDKAVIEALARAYGPISRAEIRQLTQLRWSSISPIVKELLQEGKFLEVGRSTNPMGRKQTLLRFNEDHGYILAIDFSPEIVSAAVTNLSPRIKVKVEEPTCLSGGAEGLIAQLFQCARRAIQRADIPREKLLGIGVADPGLVNAREGISLLSSSLSFWKQVPLKKLFEDEFGMSVILESSTRTQALAESVLGAGEGATDMIYIEYGRGIGAGIITGGRRLCGHDWLAGEFGHIPMVENGPACNCGSFGCLESLVSLPAMEARCRSALQEGSNSRVVELAGGDSAKVTGWHILQASEMGDKTCLAIVGELEKYLGLGIATLVNLFNPSTIVLDHRLRLAGPSFLDQIARIVKRQALGNSTANLKFLFGTLGSDAGLVGAALTVLEKIFEIPALRPPKFMVEKSVIDTLEGTRRNWAQNGRSGDSVPGPLGSDPSSIRTQ